MHTNVWYVDENVDSKKDYPQIVEAAEYLKQDEVIAFPTETVYGLGGNALSDKAVAKIFEAKGRPADNPLIVHVASRPHVEKLVTNIPKQADQLMNAFWPGPLTIVLPGGKSVATNVTAGLDTVAVRMPDHPVAIALLKAANLPLAAPSANLSGKPSPTTAKHVIHDLDGRIAGVVDGGSTGVGLESTVVDCSGDVLTILRPGGVTKEQLEEVVGEVKIDPALSDDGHQPKSPGVKYKHYAPTAPVTLVDGSYSFIQQLVDKRRAEGLKIGVLATEESKELFKADVVIPCGSKHDLITVANRLYDVLRKFDESNVDEIYSEMFTHAGVGAAVMNRLTKAANNRVIKE
ncbi:L-threonylcarbamoyladenylate synthase [Pseudalkalibacillus hwajinpoensis]|uniref:Threonylcarbamoyl-AMP synthase n=1 Tax=Guptibacillus hwajinpoensis TaxID=208199 RepID=A0A4U1MKX3_9BACL|nr:L-threonylcarbamoyladenylate synthase [Pseudalkalibacillus hwajinpoensis]TKD71080.1 threonylcarbamoyl-AMP synthase [Pseudalkalibacillus hwajinpoensis]